VKPGWTAGMTRGRLLLGRTIGPDQARDVASRRSLAEAVGALAGSAYGERVRAGVELVVAERAVAETLLWQLRILAGWLPAVGASLVRALAAWFELANIDARIAALADDGREPSPFELGGLATAWPRIEPARTLEQVVEVLALSAWGDRLGRSAPELSLGLRVAWARRVHEAAPESADWVAGGAALLVARELLLGGGRERSDQLRRLPGIEAAALAAGSIDELRGALPRQAALALAGLRDPSELWHAELRWWVRVEREARAMLRAQRDEAVVLAAVALLAADARRAVRALDAAAHGGSPELVELVDGAA
jgi:hypothetical protein